MWVAENVSSQRGLVISLGHVREFLLPHMKRMIDLVHEFGACAFHHSDGACRESIPTMAFGSVHEVRREVADNIEILGENGGLILGPCHNLQVVGPAENIVALYETGHELGRHD